MVSALPLSHLISMAQGPSILFSVYKEGEGWDSSLFCFGLIQPLIACGYLIFLKLFAGKII